jgi:hypothetical protein
VVVVDLEVDVSVAVVVVSVFVVVDLEVVVLVVVLSVIVVWVLEVAVIIVVTDVAVVVVAVPVVVVEVEVENSHTSHKRGHALVTSFPITVLVHVAGAHESPSVPFPPRFFSATHAFEEGVLNAVHSLGSETPLQFTIVVEVDDVTDVRVTVPVVVDVHDPHMSGHVFWRCGPKSKLSHSGGVQPKGGSRFSLLAAKSSTDDAYTAPHSKLSSLPKQFGMVVTEVVVALIVVAETVVVEAVVVETVEDVWDVVDRVVVAVVAVAVVMDLVVVEAVEVVAVVTHTPQRIGQVAWTNAAMIG